MNTNAEKTSMDLNLTFEFFRKCQIVSCDDVQRWWSQSDNRKRKIVKIQLEYPSICSTCYKYLTSVISIISPFEYHYRVIQSYTHWRYKKILEQNVREGQQHLSKRRGLIRCYCWMRSREKCFNCIILCHISLNLWSVEWSKINPPVEWKTKVNYSHQIWVWSQCKITKKRTMTRAVSRKPF